jgi:hypothetical protein
MRAGVQPIDIDLDKPRRLLLTVGGLKAAERELNKSRNLQPRKAIFRIMMEELPQVEQGDVGMDFCEAILWASMLHEDPALSIEAVGLMPFDLRDVMQLTLRVITETYLKMPKLEEDLPIEIQEQEKKNLMKLNGTQTSGVSQE